MKRISDRIITETIPLAECVRGDDVDIAYSHRNSWKRIGRGTLEMIKPLARGGHQIKIRPRGGTVQKHDVPAGVEATRRRLATAADGPDAGVMAPERMEIDGVLYERTPTIEARTPTQVEILPPLPKREQTEQHAEDDLRFGRARQPHIFSSLHATVLRDAIGMMGGSLHRIGSKDD